MKKIYALIAFFLAIALVGCGKKIPDCADQQVQEIINKITTDNYNKLSSNIGDKYLTLSNSPYAQLIEAVHSNVFEITSVPTLTAGSIVID